MYLYTELTSHPLFIFPDTTPFFPSSLTLDEDAEKENCVPDLSMDELLKMKAKASSRRNFALKQAERMFSFEERLTSNCLGKRGKKQLDEKKLETIRENTFKLCPLESHEDGVKAWRECRKAIDEGGRQLNFKARLQEKN